MERFVPTALGWQADVPDFRDYTPDYADVRSLLDGMGIELSASPSANSADLRDESLLGPAEDQGQLNSSCAFAVLSLVEYLERRSLGRTLEPSKLFLYQVSLKLVGAKSNTGVSLRTTLKALTRFGAPPADIWPYDPNRFKRWPTDPLLFGYTREYQSLRYFRLAPAKASGEEALTAVKGCLESGLPCVCGFTVPRWLSSAPHIPFSPDREEARGGQAVLVMGYDDRYPRKRDTRAVERIRPATETSPGLRVQGALLIRNCWGEAWGNDGYGWLPYQYVQEGFAGDFWSAVKPEWANLG